MFKQWLKGLGIAAATAVVVPVVQGAQSKLAGNAALTWGQIFAAGGVSALGAALAFMTTAPKDAPPQ